MADGETAPEEPLILTRAALCDGSLISAVERSLAQMPVLSEAERAQSLADTLAQRPSAGNGVWLFAYGSLIWNPLIDIAERRVARVEGWQRAFCLSLPLGRGSPDRPGVMLALDRGGSCTGVALRIEESLVEAELELVWRREMLSGAYVPRWVDVADPAGGVFGRAIAFTINPDHPLYLRALSEEQTVARLATARGRLGSAADYLFRTCEGLRQWQVCDPLLEHLAEAVARAQAAAPE